MLMYGTFDLASHVMTVKGDFLQGNGMVDINGGKLLVSGDYCIIGGTDKETPYSSAGIVNMDGENDYICVDGNFIIKGIAHIQLVYWKLNGYINMQYAADKLNVDGDFIMHTGNSNNLISGILTLKGDFKQINGNANNFVPSNVHKDPTPLDVCIVRNGKNAERMSLSLGQSLSNAHKLLAA